MRPVVPALLAAVTTLTACGDACVGFDDVVIEGGTAEQRATVTEALRDFADWSARETICASSISIEDEIRVEGLDGTALGRYDAGEQAITVMAEQPFLYDTVVHELCHAVDFQDDISIAFPELFTLAPFYQVAGRRDPQSLQREAMALECEVGPEALALALEVAGRCAEPVVHERASVLLELVYPAADKRIPTLPIEVSPIGSVELPPDFQPLSDHPVGTTTGGQLLVLGALSGAAAALGIDPMSGSIGPAQGQFVFPSDAPDAPARFRPSGDVDLGLGTLTAVRWPLASGDVLHFLAVRHTDGWSLPPDPCVAGSAWVVEPDGLPLLVELEGPTVRWSALDLP